MSKRTLIGTVALALAGAAPAAGQQAEVSNRVAQAMPSKYTAPGCELKAGHFKVSSAASYLKTGIEADVPENRTRALGNGRRVVVEAITQNGQEKNAAAWYYLGRIALQRGDVAEADSALTRAEALAPACAKDIAAYRRNAWAALVNAGNNFYIKQQNADSALPLFRMANRIYRQSPVALYQTGAIYNDRKQADSAAAYFGLAAEAGRRTADTAETAIARRAAFNQGVVLLGANRHAEAAAVFERYLADVPNDREAKQGLASAYRGMGRTDRAEALEREVGAAPAPGAGAAGGRATGGGASAAAKSQTLLSSGVELFRAGKHAEAARAFDQVAAAEPNNRDALYNLSSSYLALKDGPKLVASAERLVALDPLNENALKLLGEGHRLSGHTDQALKVAEQVLALPVSLSVDEFAVSPQGAMISATATGREARTATGKPIAASPRSVTFEFLDAGGAVVATNEAQIPALEPGTKHALTVEARGPGIVAWRYRAL